MGEPKQGLLIQVEPSEYEVSGLCPYCRTHTSIRVAWATMPEHAIRCKNAICEQEFFVELTERQRKNWCRRGY